MRPKKDSPGTGKKKKPAVKSPFEKFFIKKNKEEEPELPTQRRRRPAADKDETRSEKPARPVSGRTERPSRRADAGSERSTRRDEPRPERSHGRADFSRFDKSNRSEDPKAERFSKRDDERTERTNKREDARPERSRSKAGDGRSERSNSRREAGDRKSPFSGERKKSTFAPKREFGAKDREEGPRPERKTRLFDENFFNRPWAFEREEEETVAPKERFSGHRKTEDKNEIIRLNKFIAQSGICSRRKAAELVKAGEIMVNGEVNTNPAYETQEQDVITYKGQVIKKEEKLIYLLLNKPKNFITTAEDEKGRKTVLDLVKDKYTERLFPVGRLDRNTTGLILLTNDGALAKKLSHPSHQIKKIYQVELDKNLKISDLQKIKDGIQLEDGPAEVDAVDYIESGKKNEVGIEIHSGKNRIVRRIFESLGYEVVKLDRTYFAGLTKKDLPRGFSRELSEKEIIMLRHFTNRRKEG